MDSYDDYRCRCPRLGGAVHFGYCRGEGHQGAPCWNICNCWWERFDVVAYLKGSMSAAAFQKLVENSPEPKIVSLVELIAQARQRSSEAT